MRLTVKQLKQLIREAVSEASYGYYLAVRDDLGTQRPAAMFSNKADASDVKNYIEDEYDTRVAINGAIMNPLPTETFDAPAAKEDAEEIRKIMRAYGIRAKKGALPFPP